MKKFFTLLLVIFVFSVGITNAQTVPPRCGTMEYNAALEAADPSITIKRQELEQFIQKWIDENQDYINGNKSVITIGFSYCCEKYNNNYRC